MKIIIELMEAYSAYIRLPLSLVNLSGEIDYKVDASEDVARRYVSTDNLLELKDISLQLNSPTMVSVYDELYSTDNFYIISPVFNVSDSNYFLVAGPFLIESIYNNGTIEWPKIFKHEELEYKVNKISNLYRLLINKSKSEFKFSVPGKIMDILQVLGDFECTIFDYNQYISTVLDELYGLNTFDFLGLAVKDTNDQFVIQHICGEQVFHLMEKTFFVGEGLLGKAVILGKDFYWEKDSNTKRTEFFNRYGIYPHQLFGYTLKQDSLVEAIIFGGSFKEDKISEPLLDLIKCIARFVSQRKQITTKLVDSSKMQSIFANWLDLMDVTSNVKDRKSIAYKILDFCSMLNNGHFACFTTIHDEYTCRGDIPTEILKRHQTLLPNLLNPYADKMLVDANCIHFYVDFNWQRYGLFTVQFAEGTDLQQAAYILSMIDQLLQQEELSVKQVQPKEESIFHLLHTSMKQMNINQYHVANLAVTVANKLATIMQISNKQKELLLNVCKVLPYDIEYLKKHIAHTEEWHLLREIPKILQATTHADTYAAEIKIVAFIYKVIIHKGRKENLFFLNAELQELFITTYDTSIHTTDEHEGSYKDEIDHRHIEEITDLKSVIATLALTSREKEILYLILEGLNNQEVGDYLKISVHTVKNHVTNIFKKLNVSDRIQAMAKIYRIKYEEE